MLPWVNLGEWPTWLKVREVERRYAQSSGGPVRFLSEMTIRTRDNGWSERPVAVFWQQNRVREEYSNYFGLLDQAGGVMITNAKSVAEGAWNGMMHPVTGEVVFSRYRHDYRSSEDGTVNVDGGRDYFKHRCVPGATNVFIKFIDGRARVFNPAELTRAEIDEIMAGRV
ncbi:MAG: hypothetical protein EOP83_13780 [Verrucomicrobiaceae bacterium]|nr:MAG: hypothetical protein EOP83_13780 [Verrucomicrobiaceae bacterium]